MFFASGHCTLDMPDTVLQICWTLFIYDKTGRNSGVVHVVKNVTNMQLMYQYLRIAWSTWHGPLY